MTTTNRTGMAYTAKSTNGLRIAINRPTNAPGTKCHVYDVTKLSAARYNVLIWNKHNHIIISSDDGPIVYTDFPK